jgi:hypothetical protein
MKYYFTAQTHDVSNEAKARYRRVIKALEQYGHVNINHHHMDEDDPRKKSIVDKLTAEDIPPFDSQIKTLGSADALICDVTENSATVGYQVLHAIDKKIPCLVLYFKNESKSPNARPSIVFTQSHNGLLKLVTIDSWDDLDNAIDDFQVEFINKPFKFNFYIPLNLYNGIARESVKRGKTKSELVRDIIVDYLDNVQKSN